MEGQGINNPASSDEAEVIEGKDTINMLTNVEHKALGLRRLESLLKHMKEKCPACRSGSNIRMKAQDPRNFLESISTTSSSSSFVLSPPTLVNVVTQTSASWMHDYKDTGMDRSVSSSSESSVSEDLIIYSELEVEPFKPKPFIASKVGFPSIIAYVPESRERSEMFRILSPELQFLLKQQVKDAETHMHYHKFMTAMDMEKFQSREHALSIGLDLCEFCSKTIKPFPTVQQLEMVSSSEASGLFCCPDYKELYKFIVQHEKEIITSKIIHEKISVVPHTPFSTIMQRQDAREKAALRVRDRAVEKFYSKVKEQQKRTHLSGKKLNIIPYHFSREKKVHIEIFDENDEIEEWNRFFTPSENLGFTWHQDFTPIFSKTFYRGGELFLITFEDGTAQKGIYTCIIQEDKAKEPAILGSFDSTGRGTCCYPNRSIWISITCMGGLYLNNKGAQVFRWWWRDFNSPAVFTPLKPIFLSLNQNIGIRILSQDHIHITFLANGKQMKFNLGVKLELNTLFSNFPSNTWVTETQMYLERQKINIQSYIDKISMMTTFPNIKHPDRISLPYHLVSRKYKLVQLREKVKNGKHVRLLTDLTDRN